MSVPGLSPSAGEGGLHAPTPATAGQCVLLSAPPAQCPAYVIPAFMSAEECQVLRQLAEKQRAAGALGLGCMLQDTGLQDDEREALTAFEQRVAGVTGCAPHDSDGKAVFKLTCSSTGDLSESETEDKIGMTPEQGACRIPGIPMGLHVDTHNQQLRRFASIILYLNTLPPGSGGETVFPNALAAGAELLHANVSHTHTPSRCECEQRATRAAAVLLSVAQSVCSCDHSPVATHAGTPSLKESKSPPFALRTNGNAMAVCPQQGLCLLFYTRHPGTGGHVDPLSWHGGARVGDGCEKWILQKFKTVPLPAGAKRLSEEDIVRYVCEQVSLPKAAAA